MSDAELAIQEAVAEFAQRFELDDRAYEYLAGTPYRVQLRVITTFDPKNRDDADYSRKITGYIGSLLKGGLHEPVIGLNRKRNFETMSSAAGVAAASEAVDEPVDLEAFRAQFPMDDRAFDFLAQQPPNVQQILVTQFNPKSVGDSDYSGLITSMVKRVRSGQSFVATPVAGLNEAAVAVSSDLEAFRAQFPMDDRAFDFLAQQPPVVQQRIMAEFNPRSAGDGDYSGLITSIVKKERNRQNAPSAPFVGQAPYMVPQHAGYRIPTMVPPVQHRPAPLRPTVGVFPREASECEWLRSLRTCFPMDDRAFDFLLQQPMEVQETVIAEFRPRRDGDLDYSGAVTSFVKNTRNRLQADGGQSARRLFPGEVPASLLEAFGRRYPVDERAWDFLVSSNPASIRNIIENFRPKMEGEADYSSLVTSFVKKRRIG